MVPELGLDSSLCRGQKREGGRYLAIVYPKRSVAVGQSGFQDSLVFGIEGDVIGVHKEGDRGNISLSCIRKRSVAVSTVCLSVFSGLWDRG
nr:hypothetical protein CFP56_34795 [Quercus suber]